MILIALKVQNSYKQSFGAKVQRRSVQSRSDLQSKRRVERLYWRLLPGSDKVVVSYCWAELGLQMVMVKIRNDGGCMIVVQLCNCCTIVVQLLYNCAINGLESNCWLPPLQLPHIFRSDTTCCNETHILLDVSISFHFFPGFHRRENTSKVVIRFFFCAYKIVHQ